MTDSFSKMIVSNLKKTRELMMTGDSDGLLSTVRYWVSTGCWPLDVIMGGGVPGGRLIEMYGDESTGKSLLGLNIIAEVQKIGGIGVLLDSEATSSMDIAAMVGVDVNNLIIGYPPTIEQVYDHIIEFLNAKKKLDKEQGMIIPAVIVWDSVASTSTEDELSGIEASGLGKKDIAPHAREMSKMLRVLPRELSASGVTGILINQTREKIGVLYGDKTSTAGGKALKFYSSVRLKLAVSRTFKAQISDGNKPTGIEVKAVITKSKVGRPFGQCKFPIIFNIGVDNRVASMWWLKDAGVIRMSGAWMVMNDSEGKEQRFQRAGWDEMFDNDQEYIKNLVYDLEMPIASEIEEEED